MQAIDSLPAMDDLACVSVRELAATLRCSRSQAYIIARRLPEGSLVRIGNRSLRIKVSAVRALLAAGGLEVA